MQDTTGSHLSASATARGESTSGQPATGLCHAHPRDDRPCPLREVIGVRPNQAHRCRWAHAWSLQPRHARVASLMMQGMADRQIASHLGLSLSTVRTYSHEVLQAANADNRTRLVIAAIRATLSYGG